MAEPDTDYAKQVLVACVEYGRRLLALQLPEVEARNYDITPEFQKMITELYLVGVMWRYGEQFDLPTSARDRAFICLAYMLITDGASKRAAYRRIRELNSYSRDKNGEDGLAILVGYKAGDRKGALASVLDEFRNVPGAASAPYRLLERSKPIAAILAVAGLAIALLIGRSWGEALGVGFVAGLSVLAIASSIFRQMTKAKQPKS